MLVTWQERVGVPSSGGREGEWGEGWKKEKWPSALWMVPAHIGEGRSSVLSPLTKASLFREHPHPHRYAQK
jgi:hypothetical protein